MKIYTTLTLAISLFASSHATAQHTGMADMKGMEDMENSSTSAAQKKVTHQTAAVVKAADAKKGTVVLAHEPVASLNWPAMTMEFSVEDKALFSKLIVGKKVTVEFVQQGKQYVIVAVR